MAYTQAEYETLKAAVVSGVLTVRYSGPPSREITYQSLAAMRELLAEMEQDINAAVGKPPYRYAVTRKGF